MSKPARQKSDKALITFCSCFWEQVTNGVYLKREGERERKGEGEKDEKMKMKEKNWGI